MSVQTVVTGFDPEAPFGGLFVPPALRKRQKETRFKQEWRLTLAQYMALMREFKGPRKQRGIICVAAVFGSSGFVGSVVVNTHSFSSVAVSGTARSGVVFHNNGQMFETKDIGSDVEQAGEWWDNEPASGVGNEYEVRALSAGKSGTWSTAAEIDNVWITISSSREWNVLKSSPNGTKSAGATFEVGPDGVESADDSAFIDCSAQFNDL